MVHGATTLHPASGGTTTRLEAAFAAVRAELGVREEFPVAVLQEAGQAAGHPVLPDRDLASLEFVTVDPPGSMDLDQAMHLCRAHPQDGPGAAYRVRYAIADVPAFVEPEGEVDAEVRLRGQTIYCPDTRVPLHPVMISEGAASLLPDQDRPAYVWEILLDDSGATLAASVDRAMVRSRRRFTYAEVQQAVDDGTAEQTLMLLREVGRLLSRREVARGGAGLPMPEQEVHEVDGGYTLRFRPLLEAEEWNAQISLLTGMAAAELMIQGGVGILRTMAAPDERALARFRRQVRALGVDWPEAQTYGELLASLDRTDPRHLALIHDATSLFRGAGYTPFDGTVPEESEQAAIGAPYAHVTAPLRRLVDRFGLVVCAALSAGGPVPDWARSSLPELPEVMERSSQQAGAVERGCVDAVEAAVLAARVGERFAAVVVDEGSGGTLGVQVTDPAISAKAEGEATLGERVTVQLVEADVDARRVRFRVVDPA
ncbi:MAG: RNB domain-containing ribonuclease [Ornithinimicrobium sp.]|uniref:RNB domain-containing ribonuclease n=1 Tax=Ornithinimicrobium sp. TaxID=1977084 RepID=UPI003D9B1742